MALTTRFTRREVEDSILVSCMVLWAVAKVHKVVLSAV
jgi:hypothetical protein